MTGLIGAGLGGFIIGVVTGMAIVLHWIRAWPK